MTRKLYTTRIFKDDGVRLDYLILSETVTFEGRTATTFGIEISQSPINTFSACKYLKTAISDITCDYEKICTLAGELANGGVDPSVLEDIITDRIDK